MSWRTARENLRPPSLQKIEVGSVREMMQSRE